MDHDVAANPQSAQTSSAPPEPTMRRFESLVALVALGCAIAIALLRT
jgi:hypothetical protein